MSSIKQIIIIQAIMPNKTQTYETYKSESVFGRGGKSDIIVRDSGISREHMKIKLENNVIHIMDLASLNGTYIDGYKINPENYIAIQEKCVITFGKCEVKLQLRIDEKTICESTDVLPEAELEAQAAQAPIGAGIPLPAMQEYQVSSSTENSDIHVDPEDIVPEKKDADEVIVGPVADIYIEKRVEKKENRPIALNAKPEVDPSGQPVFNKLMDLSAFPKTEEDYRVNFKNVGLDLPKYKNPGEHAKEIIQEAEYQKYAIIKNAEVAKSKIVNDTRILAKKASDEAYAEYKKLVDNLLESTRKELKRLRTDTEILLDGKRLQANEEIQSVWEQHDEQIRIDKEKQLTTYEKENKIKLDLSIEKTRSDMFAERHKLLTDAETEILRKRIAYQADFANVKNEHQKRNKIYADELTKTQEGIEENKRVFKESKALRDEAELELNKIMSLLKAEKENLEIITDSFRETQENHKIIEHELANFNQTKNNFLVEIEKAQKDLAKLNSNFSILSEKKQLINEELLKMSETLNEARLKAKSEIETEYANLKNSEAKKFEDYKANELKDLQKIRDAHNDSIKSFSVDLSQEIATKLELLASKNGDIKFDFEKNFELINSVIQIKGAINSGSESKHAQQLENWKNRKRKENFSLMAKGFVAGLICVFSAKMVYDKIHIDPMKEEMARIALENKNRDIENKYEPVKTNKYFDNYVESTLFTDQFAEVFMNKTNQQEWVNYATRYFLRQWKVEEEKVISVIANSNALVQNINESIPTLKKTKIKADIAKMKELEDEYVQKQAAILGTNVKYEAYKKIEKEFFRAKLQGRAPANQ